MKSHIYMLYLIIDMKRTRAPRKADTDELVNPTWLKANPQVRTERRIQGGNELDEAEGKVASIYSVSEGIELRNVIKS